MGYSPFEYVGSAALASETGEEILSRLTWMTLEPQQIVDMGCGPGLLGPMLKHRYPDAQIIGVDHAESMLGYAKEQEGRLLCIQADAACVPLPTASVDLLIANFILPWLADPMQSLAEWRRLLRPNGLLLLTALGPDSFVEAKHCLDQKHLPLCVDMHEIGDSLLSLGFTDPVLDTAYYTLTYRDQKKLFHELYASQMLASEATIQPEAFTCNQEGIWQLTYEVIFAHAFAPPVEAQTQLTQDGTTRIPLTAFKQLVKNK